MMEPNTPKWIGWKMELTNAQNVATKQRQQERGSLHRWNSMTKRANFTRAFVLGNIDHIMLSRIGENAIHGYGLINRVREEFGILLGPSTVYPSLHFLEREGLVCSHWDMGMGKPKKVFMITQKGKQAVRHQRMAITQILTKMVEATC